MSVCAVHQLVPGLDTTITFFRVWGKRYVLAIARFWFPHILTRCSRYSILPALSLDGILSRCPRLLLHCSSLQCVCQWSSRWPLLVSNSVTQLLFICEPERRITDSIAIIHFRPDPYLYLSPVPFLSLHRSHRSPRHPTVSSDPP